MATRTIYVERIPKTDPRLGRHIRHDSESLRYRPRMAQNIGAVTWDRRVPIFDQGNLGSCTGNAGVGCMGTDPFFGTFARSTPHYSEDEAGAVQLYSDATAADTYPGQYPPDDTGSDGLAISKCLKAAGEISGYTWPLGLNETLRALLIAPLITGINWYQDMFNPTAEGLVHITGALAGGHQIVVSGYDPVKGWVWFDNSWAITFGVRGRFAMQAEDYGTLLDRGGDVTQFVPNTAPPPVPTPPDPGPTPVPDPPPNWQQRDQLDRLLSDELDGWSRGRHIGNNAKAARAFASWKRLSGL